MKTLVTGGGGFLGKEIVRQLLERGDEVLVLGRNRYPEVEEMGARSLAVDLRDRSAVLESFAGVEEVHHTAALAGIWGSWQDYYSINFVGTENVIAACRLNRVQRLVFTSSPSVVFEGRSQRQTNEDIPYSQRWLAHYPRTKMMAEKAVLEAGQRGHFRTVALRPHLIWGPGDRHLIPRLIQRSKAGKLMRVGDGENRVDVIHVENAARAHLQAASSLSSSERINGKAYFLAQDEPVKLWEFIGEILDRAGAPPVRRSISFRAAYTIGSAMELAYRAVGKKEEPRMTRFLACQLATDHYYDISRAKSDFGYTAAVSTAEGLERLFH